MSDTNKIIETCEVCGEGVVFEEYKDVYYCQKCWDKLVQETEDKRIDAAIDDELDRELEKGGEQN